MRVVMLVVLAACVGIIEISGAVAQTAMCADDTYSCVEYQCLKHNPFNLQQCEKYGKCIKYTKELCFILSPEQTQLNCSGVQNLGNTVTKKGKKRLYAFYAPTCTFSP